jgi:capsular polysaccharide export protein
MAAAGPAALCPDLADGETAIVSAGAADSAARLAARGRTVLRLRPGILHTPPFSACAPWASATIVGGARGGRTLPGAAERALGAGIAPALARRAAMLSDHIVAARIGGTCWADEPNVAQLPQVRPRDGLVLAQAGRDPAATRRMIEAVASQQDVSRIVLLLHAPDPRMSAPAAALGINVLAGPHDPWPLLDRASELHLCDGSAIGFLGLLTGCSVHCHRAAWLSGWGLTEDAPDVRPRGVRRSLTDLAAAALIVGTTYANPFTGEAMQAEAAADLVAEWRRVGDANRAIGSLTGMQFWKRRRIAEFLHTGVRAPRYHATAAAAVADARAAGGAVASWSSRMPRGLVQSAADAGVNLVRVEDGFIRSVGLGSNFLPPCSIILDSRGIYYDPAQPSDLEHLLATTEFDSALLARARRLIDRMIREGVTKYNIRGGAKPAFPAGRRRVLVPGQVANDLSVRLGGAGIADNGELLRRVRAENPDAFVIFKPHPDVDAGHRPGAVPDAQVLTLADVIVRDVSMARLIDSIDEIHTITSLAGFEGLLRARKVVTWGQPFYAGWGLTRDMAPVPRRQRLLTVEQLAACVLLLYPRYVDPVTGMPCPVEILMDRLAEPRHWRPGMLARLRQAQGLGLRRAKATWRTVLRSTGLSAVVRRGADEKAGGGR